MSNQLRSRSWRGALESGRSRGWGRPPRHRATGSAIVVALTLLLIPTGLGVVPSLAGLAIGVGSGGPRLPVPLLASIHASALLGTAPLLIHFSGAALGGAAPYSFQWTFGDGGSSRGPNVSHTYKHPGNYTVALAVGDSHNATAHAYRLAVVTGVGTGIVGSLLRGPPVAMTPSTFWSIDIQTKCSTCIASNASIRNFLNSTPFSWVRYGADAEQCNVTANVRYNDAGIATKGCAFNITSLKTWCVSRTPHCHAILNLPGENNNSAEDAAMAKYIVKTLGFQPDYWTIGNEPTGWLHYGIPWSHWRTTDHSTPTSLAYAVDVRSAIRAVSAVDPGARFIGLEAACYCNPTWFSDVGKVDGGLIDAVAYHSYPSLGQTTTSLPAFYSPLAGPTNLSASQAAVRQALLTGCPACGRLPILVNEYNAGPGWAPSNLGGSYANAVFLAASLAQALRANVTQFTIFNLQTSSTTYYGFSMLNGRAVPGPTGVLFSKLLNHLVVGKVYASRVATAVPNVWAVTTRNGSSASLLVVNANLTHKLALSLGTAFPTGLTGTIYQWSPGRSTPLVTSGLVATTYLIPSQGILLLRVDGGLPTGFVPMASNDLGFPPSPTFSGDAVPSHALPSPMYAVPQGRSRTLDA